MKKINLALNLLLICYLCTSNIISAEVEIINEAPELAQNIIPKSKQGAEALKGTWYLFYSYPENTDIKQDKIVIDSLTELVVSGKTAAKGIYYADQSSEGKTIICLDPLPDTSPDFYTCVTQSLDNEFVSFDFTLVKSSETLAYLTSGKFGIGATFDQSRGVLAGNLDPVTGYLESESTEAVYNEINATNKELDIPAVNYMGAQYRVIFQQIEEDENGQEVFKYTLKHTMLLINQLEVEAIYNEENKELEIPVFIYQGSRYKVVLKEDDTTTLKFELKEAVLITEE